MAIPIYPDTLPLPDRAPYSIAVGAGVIRTPFATGEIRQRRQFRSFPHAFGLVYRMTVAQLTQFQQWANTNGYSWFETYLESALGGGRILAPHEVRFIGDLQIESLGWNLVSVTVGAEPSPAMLAGTFVPQLPPIPDNIPGWPPTGGGGGDDFPAWIVGGTPIAPAVNVIAAGTAIAPAVVV